MSKKMLSYNLQFFAEPNTQVTTQETMSPTMKTYYDTQLLKNVYPELRFVQHGKKISLPKNHGRKVEIRKFNTLPAVNKPLVEGVTPDGSNFGITAKEVAIEQYGDYITVSDLLDVHAIDPIIMGIVEEQSHQAGDTLDLLTRDVVNAGTNVIFAGGKTSRRELTENDGITGALIRMAATQLKKTHTPKINGYYEAFIHPSIASDLMDDDDWKHPHEYQDTENIYDGELGMLHGVRFFESTNVKVYGGKDLASDSRTLTLSAAASATAEVSVSGGTIAADSLKGRYVLIENNRYYVVGNTDSKLTLASAIDQETPASVTAESGAVVYPGEGGAGGISTYSTLIFGADAYGVVDPNGGGLEMIIKSRGSAGTSDPLDQRSTAGWKCETGAIRLYEERMIRLETGSKTYSAIDAGN